jgi:hypothetical protein
MMTETALIGFVLLSGQLIPPSSRPAKPLLDPLPIRRVLLPQGRIPFDVDRNQKGALIEMARADFEARVQRAASTRAALGTRARLVSAYYRAALASTSLAGTAEFVIQSPSPHARLVLDPFNLAVRSARLDGRQAILGCTEGTSPALLVEPAGTHRLLADWSARGDQGPAGLRFELKLPICIPTTFELELPADQRVVLSREIALLSGPFSVPEKPGQRSWRIFCRGQSQLDLLIERDQDPGFKPSLVLARLESLHEYGTGAQETDFDFDIEVQHRSIRELVFACDSVLEPVSVTVRESAIKSWEIQPGKTSGEPSVLHVRLPEPFLGRTLPVRIHTVAPLPGDFAWTAPGIRLLNAIHLQETLRLKLPPGMKLANLDRGDFELSRITSESDGSAVLELESGAARNRPKLRVRFQEPDYRARETLWWHIRPEGVSLTAQITCEAERGTLSRIPLRLDADWNIEKLEASPAGLLRSWTPVAVGGGKVDIVVELDRPLASSQAVRLTLVLQRKSPPSGPADLAFPQIVLTGARSQGGALGILVDPFYEAQADTDLDVVDVFSDRNAGPGLPWAGLNWTYLFRLGRKGAVGALHVRPRPARVRAVCKTEVALISETALVSCRLTVAPELGQATELILHVAGLTPQDWKWKSSGEPDALARVERLPGMEVSPYLARLGAVSGLPVLTAGLWPVDPGSWWRITLSHPLRTPVTIKAAGDITAGAHAGLASWRVPVVRAVMDGSFAGEIEVYSANITALQYQAQGIQEVAVEPPDPVSSHRAFRYGREPASLSLSGQISSRGHVPLATVQQANLNSSVLYDGTGRHVLDFDLAEWKQPSFPIRFPAPVEILTVRVDARWSQLLSRMRMADGTYVVELPVPAGQVHTYELVYASPVSEWLLWTRLPSGEPELAVPPLSWKHTWSFPDGVAPVGESGLEASRESHTWELLPGHGSGILLIRYDAIRALTLVLSVGILLLGLAWFEPTAQVRYRFLVIWCAAGVLILLWLPAALRNLALLPLLAGTLVASCSGSGIRFGMRRPIVSTAAAVGSSLLAFWLVASSGRAQSLDYQVVWLLPGSGTKEAKVLVPQDLLDRLQKMTRAERQDSAVWIWSADYKGTVSGGSAGFSVQYQVHAETAGQSLRLPLSGVELQELSVDGAAAYPEALTPPEEGYLIRLSSAGQHQITARFTSYLTAQGTDRELRFRIPRVPECRLHLDLPKEAGYVRGAAGRGTQKIVKDTAAVRLDADLGHVSSIQVNWKDSGEPEKKAAVQADEMHVWDVGRFGARLFSVIQYTVVEGAVTTPSVALPGGYALRHVETGPLPNGLPVPRLLSWELTNGGELKLQLEAPWEGSLLVFLDLVSRDALGRESRLPLPVPRATRAGQGYVGYRVHGRPAELAAYSRVTGIEPDDFAGRWEATGPAESGVVDRAFGFKRGSGAAELLLRFPDQFVVDRCKQDIEWKLGKRTARLQATAHLTMLAGKAGLLEWHIPSELADVDVRGSSIWDWMRTGSRLRVFLQGAPGEATIEVTGSLPFLTDGKSFSFSPLRLAAQTETAFVRLTAPAGFAVALDQSQNLLPLPDSRSSGRNRGFLAEKNDYAVTARLERTGEPTLARQQRPAAPPRLAGSQVLPVDARERRPFQIVLAEQAAAVTSSGQWLHEASYCFLGESAGDLSIRLPAGAELQRVLLDGKAVLVLESRQDSFTLPLSASRGLRRLEFSWQYPEEKLLRPDFRAPEMEGAVFTNPKENTFWVVYQPPGCLLARAHGQAVTGSERESRWNRMLAIEKKDAGEEIDKMAFRLLPKGGMPTFWQGDEPPQLSLVAKRTVARRHAYGYSGLVVVFALAAWLVPSYTSRRRTAANPPADA